MDSLLEAFTVELVHSHPVPAAQLKDERMLGMVMRDLQRSGTYRSWVGWLSLKAVSARVGFVLARSYKAATIGHAQARHGMPKNEGKSRA